MTTSKVALVRCEGYDPAEVVQAVARGLELLGGAAQFVQPGERILLKPNLLVGARPEDLVSPHPTVFEALAICLQAAGASLSYGDSPGFGKPEAAGRRAGLAEVAERLGIAQADFTRGREVDYPQGVLVKRFTIAEGALDTDGIVSVCKLKAHGLTRLTGAVKNQFGCVPGLLKGEFHARMADLENFSQMLVDLTAMLAPRLYVMDGIVAMEGNGPRSGDPRPMHVVLLSADPVALDATVCRIVDVDPMLVGPVRVGEASGLGNAHDIEYVGDPVDSFVNPDFVVDRSAASTAPAMVGGKLASVVRSLVVPRPVIDHAKCTACGTCVHVCPVTPKAVDFVPDSVPHTPPQHNYDLCIRCYCCQELCPERAIDVRVPLLGRLLHHKR